MSNEVAGVGDRPKEFTRCPGNGVTAVVGDRVSDLRDVAYVLSIHKGEERGVSNRRFAMYE